MARSPGEARSEQDAVPTETGVRPVCVVLPGMLCSPTLWTTTERALGAEVETVHVPLRADSIDGMVDEVLAVPNDRFALAGLSLGGIVAMATAQRAPERVERLALLSTNSRPPRRDQEESWRAMAAATHRGHFGRVVRDSLLPLLLHRDWLGDGGLTRVVREMAEEVGPKSFLAQLAAQHTRVDLRPALSAVRCPTLVVAARQDAQCPVELHEEIAERVQGARLHILEQCGHLSPLERPDDVANRLRDWLATTPGTFT